MYTPPPDLVAKAVQQLREEGPMNTTGPAIKRSTANNNKLQKQTAKDVIAEYGYVCLRGGLGP